MPDKLIDPRGVLVMMCLSCALFFWSNDLLFYGCASLAVLTIAIERVN